MESKEVINSITDKYNNIVKNVEILRNKITNTALWLKKDVEGIYWIDQ